MIWIMCECRTEHRLAIFYQLVGMLFFVVVVDKWKKKVRQRGADREPKWKNGTESRPHVCTGELAGTTCL